MRCKCDFSTLPMPEIRLYHNAEKALKYLGKSGMTEESLPYADAQTWLTVDGRRAVVLFSKPTGDTATDAAMMAHEATHIALFALDAIGEEEPAEEELCYVVQAITLALCEMHFKWAKKHGRIKSASNTDEKGD